MINSRRSNIGLASGADPSYLTVPSASTLMTQDMADVILIRVQPDGIQDIFASWIEIFSSLLLPDPQYNGSSKEEGYRVIRLSQTIDEPPRAAHDASMETLLDGRLSICIAVEKARMGDSIPHLSFLDLHARYVPAATSSSPSPSLSDGSHRPVTKITPTTRTPTSTFSTFIQDAGRCFGYRTEAPYMILNQYGHSLLTGKSHSLDMKFLQPTALPIQGLNLEQPSTMHLTPSQPSMWSRVFEMARPSALISSKCMAVDGTQAQKALDHVKNNRFSLVGQIPGWKNRNIHQAH